MCDGGEGEGGGGGVEEGEAGERVHLEAAKVESDQQRGDVGYKGHGCHCH